MSYSSAATENEYTKESLRIRLKVRSSVTEVLCDHAVCDHAVQNVLEIY